MNETLINVYIGAIAVFGTARLTRFFAEDSFPPVLRLRELWIARFNSSGWSELAVCSFCQALYISIFTVATGMLTDFHIAWMVFYSWLSLAYLAAIVTQYDIPPSRQ